MALASGTEVVVGIKEETTFGTIAGASGAQLLRRVELPLDLTKSTFESAEKVSHGQVQDFRHGGKSVTGTLSGELSPLSYKIPTEAVFRRVYGTAPTTGAITTVAAAAGPPGTFTRSSGSFFTDGFKVGMIVRWTGWATTGTANNTRNYQITALSATVMTVRGTNNEVVAAKAAGDSVTCTMVGKHTYIPVSGRTNKSFTIEKWFADIAQSERFVGCKFASMTVSLPSEGMATVRFTIVGQDMQTGTAAYFTSPTAAATTGIVAAVNGALRVAGADVAVVTGMEFTIDWGLSGDSVVGSKLKPELFFGRGRVSGSFTALFESATLRDLFVNETEAAITTVMTTNDTITADFVAYTMSRIKVGGASKSDVDLGIAQTFPFTALLDTTGATTTGTENTTIMVQDSAA